MINRVVLAGVFSYPSGEAASSRVRNLAFGLKQTLDNVSVVSLYGRKDQEAIIDHQFITERHSEKSSIVERILMRIEYFKTYKKLARLIVNNLKGNENELIFLYGRSYMFLSYLLKLIAKKNFKTKVVFDVVEPPRTKSSYTEYLLHPFVWDSVFVFHFLLSKFDACVFITSKLKDTFGHLAKRQMIMPSIINFVPREVRRMNDTKSLQLAYLGALLEKDNPKLLFDLCNLLKLKTIEFELKIIGKYDAFEEGRKWKKKFMDSDFSDKINFFPSPTDHELISLLESVDFMTIFRKPEPLQSFTFPTRCVEGLSLGKVLIINDFGDFAIYFRNGENAIVVNADAIEETISRISDFLVHDNYIKVLNNSNELLKNEFNAIKQGKKLLDLFNSPCTEKKMYVS
jgi:glycosyltransferase involved in cell wall biosynthesis